MALWPIASAHAGKLAALPLRMDGAPTDPRRERFLEAVTRGLQQGVAAGLTVSSSAEVRGQLSGDLATCVDGPCITSVAKALGVERVVISEVAIAGKNYSITLRLVDSSGTEQGRTADRCDICTVREADEALTRAATRLAGMIKLETPLPPVKVETPPPVKVETPPPVKVETPPPVKIETPPPLPPDAMPITSGEAPNPVFRYGWISSLVVGGALLAVGVPFLVYAGKDNKITCADGTDPKACPTIYKGNTAIGAALVGSGILLGGVGFGTFYFLDRRERQRVSGRVSLSGTAGGALLTTEGRF